MVTIAQERATLKTVGMVLRSREQAGFRFNYTTARSVSEPATKQVVHITITNPENYNSDDAHARAVEAIGIARFPNTAVSYNRLFMRSGAKYEGQPMGRRGAHTVNDFHRSTCTTSGCPTRGSSLTAPDWNLNYNARAYVICQNVQHSVTDAQLDSLAQAMAADRLAGFVTRDASIHGHRCCSAKECPGPKMWALMGRLEGLVLNYVKTGFTPPPPKDWFDMATEADLKKAVQEAVAALATKADVKAVADKVPTAEENRKEFWYGVPVTDKQSGAVAKDFMSWLQDYIRRDTARAASYSAQALTVLGGLDIDKLAAAIVAKLPNGQAIDKATVIAGVREALGSLDEV